MLAAAMAAGLGGFAVAQENQPLPEADRSTIGYPTVEAALTSLKARRDVVFSTQGDWTIVNEPKAMVLWSFPGKNHPAYPSAVRRAIRQGADGVYIDMAVHCEASKAACDDLVLSFRALNQQMTADMRGR